MAAVKISRFVDNKRVDIDVTNKIVRVNGRKLAKVDPRQSSRFVFKGQGLIVKLDSGFVAGREPFRGGTSVSWQCHKEGLVYDKAKAEHPVLIHFLAEVLAYDHGWIIQRYYPRLSFKPMSDEVADLTNSICGKLGLGDINATKASAAWVTKASRCHNVGVRSSGLPLIFDYAL